MVEQSYTVRETRTLVGRGRGRPGQGRERPPRGEPLDPTAHDTDEGRRAASTRFACEVKVDMGDKGPGSKSKDKKKKGAKADKKK
jgi:hypothetical protein